METDIVLQLAIIGGSLQVVAQLLGTVKAFYDWKAARINVQLKPNRKRIARHRK